MSQDQVLTPNAGEPQENQVKIEVEIVEILKRWNISESAIKDVIKYYLVDNSKYIILYRHETWGSCREWKHVVMNEDGSYINDGEWIDNSSRKNAHKRKIIDVSKFLEKYGGKNLMIYVYESPSCNKSKEFSFKAIFRVFK